MRPFAHCDRLCWRPSNTNQERGMIGKQLDDVHRAPAIDHRGRLLAAWPISTGVARSGARPDVNDRPLRPQRPSSNRSTRAAYDACSWRSSPHRHSAARTWPAPSYPPTRSTGTRPTRATARECGRPVRSAARAASVSRSASPSPRPRPQRTYPSHGRPAARASSSIGNSERAHAKGRGSRPEPAGSAPSPGPALQIASPTPRRGASAWPCRRAF